MIQPATFTPIEEALEAIRRGEILIVVDDEDRENEGDFIMAAERVTAETVNFMACEGRGLICAPIAVSRADELGQRSVRWSIERPSRAISLDPGTFFHCAPRMEAC